MSLIYFDGFDFLDTPALVAKALLYNNVVPTSTTRYSYGHSIINSSVSGGYTRFLLGSDTGSNYIIFGAAVWWLDNTPEYEWGVSFLNSSGYQFAVTPASSGTIAIRQGSESGTVLVTSEEDKWSAGTWHYLEGKMSATNSSDYEIRIDGETIMSGSGVDLQSQASPGVDRVQLRGGWGDTYSCSYDDLYICDDQGSKNNDFLGEVIVRTLLPTGAGTYTQWTPSAGSNYENVDEEDPDDDTTYNSTGVEDNQDSFAVTDLPDSQVAVHGVRTRVYARKEGAGYRALKNYVVVNSSKYDEAKNTLSLSYNILDGSVLEDNPDDSQDWEVADIDAMEVGVQLAAVQSTTTTTV